MKKAFKIIKSVLVWTLVVAVVGIMLFTILSVTVFDKPNTSILGFKAFIVLTDSMSATDFDAGDLIISQSVDPATLKEGDIITFQSLNEESYGETVTHKIRKLTTNEEGRPGFITYGTTTNTDDEKVVTYEFVYGKYQFCIPKAGLFFQFLKTTPGYIICILIPFLLLILFQGINTIKIFRRYKREQMEKLQAERSEIEEQRAESMKMMEELQRLQAQLAEKNEATASKDE
ncbi:MAG: signal peptidase I [Acutalibacteraceae bacterium]